MMGTYHAILLNCCLLASNGRPDRTEAIGKEKINNLYKKETRRLRAVNVEGDQPTASTLLDGS